MANWGMAEDSRDVLRDGNDTVARYGHQYAPVVIVPEILPTTLRLITISVAFARSYPE